MKENDKGILILVLSGIFLVSCFGFGLVYFYPKEASYYRKDSADQIKYAMVDFKENHSNSNNDKIASRKSEPKDVVVDGSDYKEIVSPNSLEDVSVRKVARSLAKPKISVRKSTSKSKTSTRSKSLSVLRSLGKPVPKKVVSNVNLSIRNSNRRASRSTNLTSRYWIQVASLKKIEKSKELQTAIDLRSSVKGQIFQSTVNGAVYYRLRYGPFSKKEDALTFNNWLKSNQRIKDAYLTRVFR